MRARRAVSPIRAGFTLMEVIVGLTVAAMALSAGFAVLAFIADREGPTDAAAAEALRGATTRALLTSWLGEARLQAYRRGPQFQGYDGEEQGTPSDEIYFPTTAGTPLGVGTTLVRLFVDRDEQTPERGLVAELTERVGDEPRLLELVPEVGVMDIRYLMAVQGAYGEWVDTYIDSNTLPRAVEVTLQAVAPDTLPSLLRYPLRVVMETVR